MWYNILMRNYIKDDLSSLLINISRDDEKGWHSAFDALKRLFRSNYGGFDSVKYCAQRIYDYLESLEPLIQHGVSNVCPSCEKVCCVNRYGYFDVNDMVYLLALDNKYHRDYERFVSFTASDTTACAHLNQYGCSIERPLRPFRCNWFFCAPLIDFMSSRSAREFRDFSNRFSEIIRLRKTMIDNFCYYIK
ncbi:hypothetical protein MCHI_003011 [Candidatus Magnetoovum chiemensis]|nr:hypothetical protein MCHI_003011 [Candidatus Magnetoovum chiemensis]